jgi:hypothetical protein
MGDKITPLDVGGLHLRAEGPMWRAYYSPPAGIGGGRFEIGSIAMAIVAGDPTRKAQFVALMESVVADIVEAATGRRPTFAAPRPAPGIKRGGHA